jgi:hypothetical protein
MAVTRGLPEGPVTIMFTDIEGSTVIRTSLGDADTDGLFRDHGHDPLRRQGRSPPDVGRRDVTPVDQTVTSV